ncbi:MAG: hypothetical protein U0M51_04320 [Eggerthellaceae bacterium]
MTGLMREMTGLERLRNVANAMRGYAVRGGGPLDLELMRIADQIERETVPDPADCTTVSAYDLLPEEDRKAIAWVREKGGVNALSMGFQDADNRRIELCSSLGIDLETGWADAMVAMRCRLMPEGMEWPRYESGEPVRPGDKLLDKDGDWFEAVSFVFTCDWWSIRGYQTEGFGDLNDKTRRTLEGMSYGARVKRPEPRVLDADGVEIRIGDTVCGTRDMESMRVVDTDSRECGFKRIKCEKEGDGFFFYCADELTHQLPVLAADGKPLREGDTVYEVEGTGRAYKVLGIRVDNCDPLTSTVVTCDDGDWTSENFLPSQLTHERPESWERLEEDADKNPFDYCKDVGHRLDTCENSEAYKARDLVRRAKKLAGVEA